MYKPVAIQSDFGLEGFSSIEITLFLSSNSITPNLFGSLTQVKDPNRFGVIEFDDKNKVISIEEKPSNPKSDWIATGLYIYGSDVVEKTKTLTLSERGELEITDLNNLYLKEDHLKVELLDKKFSRELLIKQFDF